MSKFDKYYRKALLSKIFVNGWGNPDLIQQIIENHKIVSKRKTCKSLVTSLNVTIDKKVESNSSTTIDYSFLSPFHYLVPNVMDENNRKARFQLLIPKPWDSKYKPLCIHFPGTGDHGYSRRKTFLANRLLKDKIASLILINPYYGERKPKNQNGSSLNYLSDLFVMGGALILETNFLLQWAKKEGFDPLAVHGISMGGHMACLGASVYPEPVCLIPCLSWTTASHVFTQGAMSSSVSWDVLSDQFYSDEIFRKTIRSAINPPIPPHLKRSDKLIQSSANLQYSIQSNNKLKKPFDNLDRNLHLKAINKDLSEPKIQFYSSDKTQNNEKVSKLRNFQNTFSWRRPLELMSFMRSVSETDKISKEELDTINKQETEMKYRLTFEKFFSRSIPVDRATIEFMHDMLDYFTHLGNYSVPVDTRLATIYVAGNDAYIPMEGVSHFYDIWDNRCDIRIRKGVGHVEAYLRNSLWTEDGFREAIVDTLNRYVELYYNEEGPIGKIKS